MSRLWRLTVEGSESVIDGIPDKAFQEYEVVRLAGITNMFDRNKVLERELLFKPAFSMKVLLIIRVSVQRLQMLNMQNLEIYEIHSEFLRAIANPKRLRILNEVGDTKITVGELASLLNISVSNISQHLKILKNYEILKSEKIGHRVYYSITDIRIVEICQSMRQVISDLYEKRMDIFSQGKTE